MESKILSAIGIDPAFILLFLFLLIIVLFVLNVSVTMKYNRLKSSYNTFMKGKDGKTLEESMKEMCIRDSCTSGNFRSNTVPEH